MAKVHQTITAALIQHTCSSDPAANFTQITEGITAAAARGAQLILLQELHNSLYFCQTEDTGQFDLAEPIPGPTTEKLSALAKQHQLVIVASLFERRAAGLYHNTAVVFECDGSIAGCYRKMHIPDDPGFYEKFYFTPGDMGFTPIATSVGKLGVLVCWDQWFPEAARLMALAGADLLLYPTAIGWDMNDSEAERNRQLDAWVTVQRGHAIANGLPLLACNRTGFEAAPGAENDGIKFWGNSFVAGPQGEFLARANSDAAETLLAEIDLQRSENVRRIWPYLRDRRIDAYQDLLLRFRDNTGRKLP
ncbi:MAG: carbon-nitrogen hydrolase [Gammaproteobacteria bacterium]|nr:carbon-nitrogen hydrolase [Gammaproteobacteria bacterium]MDH5652647.1 carbon-nitrogen hydrolase [Gammaproteobacteria bacterium]